MLGRPVEEADICHDVITWKMVCDILENAYGPRLSNVDVRRSITEYIQKAGSNSDTVAYMTTLDQLYAYCKEPVDDQTRILSTFDGLRPDIQDKVRFGTDDKPWSSFQDFRSKLNQISPFLDLTFKQKHPQRVARPKSHRPASTQGRSIVIACNNLWE